MSDAMKVDFENARQSMLGLGFGELMLFRDVIEARMEELQTTNAGELREKWRMEAAALGLEASVLIGGKCGKKKRPARNAHKPPSNANS